MTDPVTKAMIESYALMVMVMGTFFFYFCGMVWAFCNPKLSAAEERLAAEARAEPADAGARLAAPLHFAEGLARTTYVNFREDADSLLHEGHGIGDLNFKPM